jgi:hypothetical protein
MNHDNAHNGHRDAILNTAFEDDADVSFVTYQDPWGTSPSTLGSTARPEVPDVGLALAVAQLGSDEIQSVTALTDIRMPRKAIGASGATS